MRPPALPASREAPSAAVGSRPDAYQPVAKAAAGAHLPLTLQGKVKGAGRRRRKYRDFFKAVFKD
jgi:hypothetical protein